MTAEIIETAALIVDPRSRGYEGFTGTFAAAMDAMVRWANLPGRHDADPVARRGAVAKMLAASDPDRVAEICAGALLLLRERDVEIAGLRALLSETEDLIDPCDGCGGKGCDACARYVVDVYVSTANGVEHREHFHTDRADADRKAAHLNAIYATRTTYGGRAEVIDRQAEDAGVKS